jgi:hypothetical protein
MHHEPWHCMFTVFVLPLTVSTGTASFPTIVDRPAYHSSLRVSEFPFQPFLFLVAPMVLVLQPFLLCIRSPYCGVVTSGWIAKFASPVAVLQSLLLILLLLLCSCPSKLCCTVLFRLLTRHTLYSLVVLPFLSSFVNLEHDFQESVLHRFFPVILQARPDPASISVLLSYLLAFSY